MQISSALLGITDEYRHLPLAQKWVRQSRTTFWGSGFKMLLPSRIMLCWRPMTTDNIRCSTCASWRQTGWTKTAGGEDLFCVRRSLFIYSCWNFFYEMVGLESTLQLKTEKLFFVESMWSVHPVILQCSGWVHDFVVTSNHSVVKSNGLSKSTHAIGHLPYTIHIQYTTADFRIATQKVRSSIVVSQSITTLCSMERVCLTCAGAGWDRIIQGRAAAGRWEVQR